MNFINRRIKGTVATPGRLERRQRARRMVLCAIAPIAAALSTTALAPSAGAAVQLSGVESGSASVSQRGAVTTIKTSNNAILNFSQFNIAAGSTVNFLQPSAISRVLDRVNSATPSLINGSLISNGTVYLINPAGVIFGGGASVDVNRFYVAGSHMSDQDFLSGVDHFSGITGMVSNSGQIRAGQVYMVGSQVINQGSIVSPNGVVAMVSGSDVVVSEPGSHVTATVVPAISASGATGGAQKADLRISPLAAGDAYSLAIRHTGSIQASTVLINGGGGQVQVSGSINVSSQAAGSTGGSVSITGGEIDLVSALINASGPAGGGQVLIGGGPHGSGSLSQADVVSFDSGSDINADATVNGQGGSIVLWGDSSVTSAGVLTARGGSIGGDGGYIETSAPSLQISSSPDASAPNGKPGSWVLDPATVEIVASGGDGTDTVNASSIDTSLDAGTSVTLTATTTLSQDASAPIMVTAASPATLVLQAGTTMTLSGGITTTGGAALNVELDGLGGVSSTVEIDTNPININGTLAIVGGNVTLAATSALTASSVTMGTGVPITGGGSVATGTVTLNGPVTSTAGAVTIGPSTTDTVNAAVLATGGGFSATGSSFTSGSSGTITANGGNVALTETGTIGISGAITTNGGTFSSSGTAFDNGAAIATANGNATITNTGAITIAAPITTGSGNFSATGGTAFNSTAAGTITTAGGTVTIQTSGVDTIGGAIGTGGGSFVATGTGFSDNAAITDSGASGTFSATAGVTGITISSGISWGGTSVTLESIGGLVNIATGGSITSSGEAAVSLYTTGAGAAISIVGAADAVNTNGAFVSDGGNFTVDSLSGSTPVLNALSISINTTTSTPGGAATLGTVNIIGPVATTGNSTTGTFAAGGATSFTNSGNGTITTSGGNVTITNTGTVDIEQAVATSGGSFSASGELSYTATTTFGTITTGGGSVTIHPTAGITLDAAVNTGGGAFNAGGTDFNNTADISTANGNVAITNTGIITIGGAISTGSGTFSATGGTSFSSTAAGTITTADGSVTIHPTTTTVLDGAVTTGGGAFSTAGTDLTTGAAISTSNGNVAITNTGTITIGAAVTTGTGSFSATGGTAFTSTATTPTGTITTSDGNVTIQTSGIDTIGAMIATGGGSFLATGSGVTVNASITDGGAAGTDTFSATAGVSGITISSGITWGGASVTLASVGGPVTVATGGSIAAGSGATSVIFSSTGAGTSGAITLDGPITTNGGNFTSTVGASFISSAAGTISTSGGSVTIATTGSSGITLAGNITTGSGGFSATGASFTETGTVSGTGAYVVNMSSGTGNITISQQLSRSSVLLETGGDITIATGGSIIATGTVALYGTSSNSLITIGGPVTTPGVFIADGGSVTVSGPTSTASPAPTLVNALSVSFNTATMTPDSKSLFPGSVTISSPIVSASTIAVGGASLFLTNQSGSITSAGDLTISNTGDITIGQPITTGGGAFTATMAASFSSSNDGSITTSNGAVAITTNSSSGISIGDNLSAGSGAITLYGTGSSSSIKIGGVVSTTAAFVAAGGDITISPPTGTVSPAPTMLSALSVSLDTATMTTSSLTLSAGTVYVEGPVVTHGDFDAGGNVQFLTNQSGSITTNGGNVNITNSAGLIAIGEPVVTDGGNFTSTLGEGFSNTSSGTITTGGGNVTLATSGTDEIAIEETINTGGGSFTATAMGMEITGDITDGGVGTHAGNLTINTTSGTDPITSLTSASVISWTGGNGRAINIEGGGNIVLNSVVSTGTALPVSLYSTAPASSSDSITLNGPVVITGPFVAAGGGFTLSAGATLTATTVNINTLTTTPDNKAVVSGAIMLSGPVNSAGATTIDGTSFDVVSTGQITTNGGPLTVDSSGVITIEGALTTEGGAVSVSTGSTFTSDSNGTITSGGGDVALVGTGGVTVSAAVNTGGGSFSAAGSTFDNTAEISDGGVDDSKAQGVTISASSGSVTIGGEISWVASLSPIKFVVPASSTIQLGSSIIANPAEALNLSNSTIEVTGTSAEIAGGNITLGPLTSATTGTISFEVQSSGSVSLQTIGTAANPFGQLIITNNNTPVLPTTTLNGNIFTVGTPGSSSGATASGLIFSGPVVVASNVQIADSDSNVGDLAIMEFDSAIEGPGGLTIVLPSTVEGEVRFNSNIGDVVPVAFLNFFTGSLGLVGFRMGNSLTFPGPTEQQPLTTVNIASGGAFEVNNQSPPVRDLTELGLLATIDSYGPLAINIGSASTPNAANLYAVGQNEKLSVFGDLTLNTNGGTITTGDISTLGNMTLDAANVNFLLRGPTLSNGTEVDTGVDLIAGGKMTLPQGATFTAVSGNPVAGSFDVPGFIAQSYSSSISIGSIASQLKTAFSFVGGLSPSVLFAPQDNLFDFANLLLDLTPNTLTTSIPAFVPPTPFVFDYGIAGAAPQYQLVAGTVPTDFRIAYPPAVPGPIVQEELKDDGLYTQDPTLEEILGAVDTMAVYDDMPDRPRPRSSDYRVVVNRLDSRRVGAFLAEYKQVFGGDAEARKTRFAADIQSAWDAYVSQNGDRPVSGAGFAQYCAGTPSAGNAGAALQQLHGLRIQLGALGLSYKEAQVAFQYNVLTGISAVGMREGDLATAVVSTPANR